MLFIATVLMMLLRMSVNVNMKYDHVFGYESVTVWTLTTNVSNFVFLVI